MTDNKKLYILSDAKNGEIYKIRMSEDAAKLFWWLYKNDFFYDDGLTLTEEKNEIIDLDEEP